MVNHAEESDMELFDVDSYERDIDEDILKRNG
jgi:hypothetical protein